MRADLLLVGEDGVPIVGEVKSATASGYDTDAVLALVQGLTACAQLLPPQQMERLEKAYPYAQFRDLGARPVRHRRQARLAARATYQSISTKPPRRWRPSCPRGGVPARRIAFIEARWDGQLELRLAALGSRPNGR